MTTARKKTKPKPKRKKEPQPVTMKTQCPRCGEVAAIRLVYTSTDGIRRYRCYSEQCQKHSVNPGSGRGFVVMRQC